jgi:hypothetical protein
LGLLIFGFLFFVINTIRCYLTRPRNIDFEDEEMPEQELGDTEDHEHNAKHQNSQGYNKFGSINK